MSLLPSKMHGFMKFSSLFGLFLSLLTDGISWYWGNMNIYVNSFFAAKLGSGLSGPWVICFYNVGWTVGVLLAGQIIQKYGLRWTVFAGSLLVDAGLLSSYLTLQYSQFGLSLSMGFVTGLGYGCTITASFLIVKAWCSRHAGAVTGLIVSSPSLGAMIITFLTTRYVNQDNLAPDTVEGRSRIFSQDEVIDRVPSLFAILAVLSFCIHLTGFGLLRVPPDEEEGANSESRLCAPYEETTDSSLNDEHWKLMVEDGYSGESNSQHSTTESETRGPNFKPKEILKSSTFYVLWTGLCFCEYTFDAVANFYKQYGLISIQNDHFLAQLGTAFVLSGAAGAVIQGVAVDKIGVKNSLILMFSNLSLTTILCYFTPMYSKWIYCICVMLLGSQANGAYLLFSIGTYIVFGSKHYADNYSLILTAVVFLNLVAPSTMTCIIQKVGWFYLFFTISAMNTVGLIESVLLFPNL